MAGRRVAAAGTLVLDAEGLSKLAAGDARTRAYMDSARARGGRIAVSAITLTEVLRAVRAIPPRTECFPGSLSCP